MRPTPSSLQNRHAPGIRLFASLMTLALLAGCGRPLSLDSTIPRKVAEIGCVSRCQSAKDTCDADARYAYRQCETGYSEAIRDYRWCQASGDEQCGYPWWSCAENLYGYCSNRYWDCRNACRATESRRYD